MLRFKLANGGTIASCKQPLQNKDFDRIEISDNYDEWHDRHGSFYNYGGPPYGEIEVNVKLSNPSTHTIRKSYCKNFEARPRLQFGPVMNGNVGGSNGNKRAYGNDYIALSELNYGEIVEYDFTPILASFRPHYSHTINPFDTNWYNSDSDIPEDQSLEPFENYWGRYYEVYYELHFVGTPHNKTVMTNRLHYGGGGRKMIALEHSIDYHIY